MGTRSKVLLQYLRGRVRDLARSRGRQDNKIDAARFVTIFVDRVEHGDRHRHIGGQGVDDLLTEIDATLLAHESLLGITIVAQQFLELGRIEFARRTRKGLIRQDGLGDVGVRHGKAKRLHAIVEGRLRNDPAEHLPVEAHGAGLIIGDGAAILALNLLKHGLVLVSEGFDRNFRVADLCQFSDSEPAENISHAPDCEAEDDETHHHGHDDPSEPSLGSLAHAVEHDTLSTVPGANRPFKSARTIGRASPGGNAGPRSALQEGAVVLTRQGQKKE